MREDWGYAAPLRALVKEIIIRAMFLPETLRRQPQWLVLLAALGLVGLIGWFDYATAWEWSFFAPYAVPIVLVAWQTDRRLGFAFALLCAVTFWVVHIGSHPYQTGWGFPLAVAGWWFYFSVLVVAASAVKAHREIARARVETLEDAQAVEGQNLRTSDREQQRIGRDLHDSLGPHLAAISYAATFLADDLRPRDPPAAAKAEQIRTMVNGAVSLARDLARGLFPVQMDGAGLALALEELAGTSSRLTGMAVSFYETGDTQVADPEEGLHLYRIAQEALNNAAKHGGARKVTILLNKSQDSLRLTIADDGKGMAQSPQGTRGMGLDSMRYRARALGGELTIDSHRGEGTIVSCEIPNRPPRPATPDL